MDEQGDRRNSYTTTIYSQKKTEKLHYFPGI